MADLLKHPEKFEFFQALRLVERGHIRGVKGRPVGLDHEPQFEAARFRGTPSLGFQPSAIRTAEPRRNPVAGGAQAIEFGVTFMGALGICAELPWHYTEEVFERLSKRDTSLLDFVDTLQHRSISFFYRAWRKYRLPYAYEAAHLQRNRDDITSVISALVGLETEGLRERPAERAESWFYFAGLFGRQQRTAIGLETMIEAIVGYPTKVHEFVGRWQELVPEERTRLGERRHDGFRSELGSSAVLGDRVWDVLSGVRIEIGPVRASAVHRLAPRTGDYPWLPDIVRSYLGPDVDFDIYCRVQRETVQPARLGGDSKTTTLGESLWLGALDPNHYDDEVPICLDR